MKRMRGGKFPVLLVLAAFRAAGTARAGSITAVTAPPTVAVRQPVTITIQGVGPCASVTVNYNTAFTTVLTYSPARFPFLPPAHTYTGTGSKTILVTATGNCSGRATTTINVTAAPPPPPPAAAAFSVPPSLSALCARVACGSNSSVLGRPTINEVLPASVQPLQMLMISGFSLGTAVGQIRLRLPNGSAATATVDSWTPFAVTGTLDEMISGVGDGDAQVIIQRADNVLSNPITVHFAAWRDPVVVPTRYVRILTCDDGAVVNECVASNDIYSERIDFARIGVGSIHDPRGLLSRRGNPTVDGIHRNFWDDWSISGTDRIQFSLPEGFVLGPWDATTRDASYQWSTYNVFFVEHHGGTTRVDWPAPGVRSGTITVSWQIGVGAGSVEYWGSLLALGPRGVDVPP